eukprot:COSAG02_NODE_47563_length_340_cov_0.838174_1_plen_91_part_01
MLPFLVLLLLAFLLLFHRLLRFGPVALDFQEFSIVVRKQCDLTEEGVSRAELRQMFNEVDSDCSGAIDEEEFVSFLLSDPLGADMTYEVFE